MLFLIYFQKIFYKIIPIIFLNTTSQSSIIENLIKSVNKSRLRYDSAQSWFIFFEVYLLGYIDND